MLKFSALGEAHGVIEEGRGPNPKRVELFQNKPKGSLQIIEPVFRVPYSDPIYYRRFAPTVIVVKPLQGSISLDKQVHCPDGLDFFWLGYKVRKQTRWK